MRKRKYEQRSVLLLLTRCYKWMDVEACREMSAYMIQSGEVFATQVPIDVFRMSVAKEMQAVEGRGADCAEHVRTIYEQYVTVHCHRMNAWLEYVRYELEFGTTKTISRINWRAKKGLGDASVDAWESAYAQLKLNL